MNTIRRNKNSVTTWLALTILITVFCLTFPVKPAAGAAPDIELISQTTATHLGETARVIDKPADVQDGDVLIAHWALSQTNGTWTPPSGWTEIYNIQSCTDQPVGAWYKVITNAAEEPSSYEWTPPDPWETSAAAITCWRGVDTTDPINASAAQQGVWDNKPIAPSITTTAANCQILAQNMHAGAETHTPPSGMAERYDFTDNNDTSITLADVNQASAGATGDKEFTASAANCWYAALIALKPAQSAVNWAYTESEAQQSTTSETFQDAATLDFTAYDGDYIVIAAFELRGPTSYPVEARLLIEGVEEGLVSQKYITMSSQAYHSMGWIKKATFTEGSKTIKVQYRTTYGPFTSAYIRNIHIFAWKPGTLQYTATETEQNLTTTETTLASLNFTPSATQDYLILASVEGRPASTGSSIILRLKVDSTEKNRIDSEGIATTDYRGHGIILLQNLDTTSHTIQITGQAESGTMYARRIRIAAIPIGSLTHYSATAETETSSTSMSYVDKLSYSPTISNTDDHIILATSETKIAGSTRKKFNNLLIDSSQYHELIEYPKDDTDYVSTFFLKKLNLSAGSHTFKIQHKNSSILGTVYTKNARIVAMQLPDPTAVAASLTLANHDPEGQIGDQFSDSTPVTDVLFRFNLTRSGTVTVDNVRVNFTTGDGVANGDVSTGELWEDVDNDGVVDDPGDTQIQGSVTPSSGVLTFTTNFTPGTGGTNYLVRATVSSLTDGDTTTFSVGTADIDEVEGGVSESGSITDATHTQDTPGTGKFLYRKKITIDHNQVGASCGADLEDFPLLVSLTGNWLKTTTVDSENGRIEHEEGYDIVFRAADGTTHLDHEKELYDGDNGTLVAWVRIPTLSHTTPDTYIYMYYGNDSVTDETGNPTGVWDDNYRAVWHLGEEYGLDFGGTAYVDCGTIDVFGNASAMTISSWVKSASASTGVHNVIASQGDVYLTSLGEVFVLNWDSGEDVELFLRAGGTEQIARYTDGILDTDWHHVVGLYDGANVKVYVDTVEGGTSPAQTGSLDTPTSPLRISGQSDATYPWNGTLNEVRIWNRALSPTEISDLYDGTPVSRTGLVAEYLMNEGAGVAVADSSGQGNDGDMTDNPATWVGAPKDSTQYANHGVAGGSPGLGVTGQMGEAVEFYLGDEYIDCGESDLGLTGLDEMTFEVWFVRHTAGGWHDRVFSRGNSDPFAVRSAGSSAMRQYLKMTGGSDYYDVTGFAEHDTNWYSYAIRVKPDASGDDWHVYENGVKVGGDENNTGTFSMSGVERVMIGATPGSPSSNPWDGIIDEVRVSNIDRGACWIETSYNNQNSPATFYDVGDEEYPAPTAVDIIFFNAIGQDASVLVEWETAQEIDNLGFNLYRSSEPYGSYTKLNSSLIPGLISSVSGQQYTYIDKDVTRDVLYYYMLEDVGLKGKGTMHGPVCVDWDGDGIPDGYDEQVDDDDSDEDTDDSDPEVRIPELRLEEVDFGLEDWTPSSSYASWVKLASFRARQGDEGVALEWETSFEVDNFGFHVYREVDGKFYRITPDLVPGSVFKVGAGRELPAGQSYVYWDGLSEGTGHELYWLDSVELNGGRASFGPIKPEIYGQPVSERLKVRFRSIARDQVSRAEAFGKVRELRKELSTKPIQTQSSKAVFRRIDPEKPSEPRLPPSEEQWVLSAQPGVKIYIREDGWYRVGEPELVAVGLRPGVDPRYLQLYADGEEKSMMVTGSDDGRFDPEDAIEFYGTGLDTPFTDAHVYWLVVGSRPGRRLDTPFIDIRLDLGKRMRIPRGLRGRGAPLSFPYSVELKERTFYFAALTNGERENFFGSVISTDPVDQLLTVAHPDPSSPEDATLEVVLQGATDSTHQIKIMFNYVEVGEVVFSGQEREAVEIQVPYDLLLEGDNIVTLTAQGGAMDVSLVDYIRLTYWCTYTADEDVLQFKASGGEWLSIGGFSSSEIQVVDITDPMRMINIRGKVKTQDSGYAITVKVPPSAGERTLLAFTEDKIKLPAGIEANLASSWHEINQGAEVIIIGHSDLLGSVGFLKELREQQGWSVVLVDVEDLYDEFNFGAKSPWALKDFLAQAYQYWNPQPRYLILVGDTSYDPRNYLGYGEFDLLPTKFVDTENLKTASDDWFVDFDDDGLPEMAVGRLPVESAEEAATVVAKIINYEGYASLMNEVLLVSDRNDFYNFEQASAKVKELIPENLSVNEIFRGRSATTKSDLLDLLNQGQLLVNYFGHGSTKIWKGNLLTYADAWNLTNSPNLPFFVSTTCLNGFFQDPYSESLAEALLKVELGGAVAVWTSSGLTDPEDQEPLNKELIQLLFNGEGLTLGEAIMGAKQAATDRDVRRTWILFGDPTLRLK